MARTDSKKAYNILPKPYIYFIKLVCGYFKIQAWTMLIFKWIKARD